MGDVTTPPPSYETATTAYVPPTNQFFRNAPQTEKMSAPPPPSNDEIILASIHPLLPPPRASTSATGARHSQSTITIVEHRTRRPTLQANTVQLHRFHTTNNKTGFCIFLTVFSLAFFIFIIVMIARVLLQRADRLESNNG